MLQRGYTWCVGLLVATALAGCVDGGRGSTGFDISENAAIKLVLQTQECIIGGSLTLCPADQSMPDATPTPTVAPPDPTATPGGVQRVDTSLANGASITCVRSAPDDPCIVELSFSAIGFPPTSTFGVATRLHAPETDWQLAPTPTSAGGDPAVLTTTASIDVPAGTTDARLQFAVLVFLSAPASIPATFEELIDSGADYAFVTAELALDIVLIEPTPTPTGETPTPSPTLPTPTATPSEPVLGPLVTHLGVARADNLPLAPSGTDALGRPIFVRPFGSGMTLIVEGAPGLNRRPVGSSAFRTAGLPDLEIILSNALGDGSRVVCDTMPPNAGGVPATVPFAFNDDQATADAINDLGCRVDDGAGEPRGRRSDNACTTKRGDFAFVNDGSTLQFCLPIAAVWDFAQGDTVVAARLRDIAGVPGPAREMIVRIGRGSGPTPTPTIDTIPPTVRESAMPTPTSTPTATVVTGPSGPRITHFGLARADSSPIESTLSDAFGRPIFTSPVGQGMSLIVEAQPGSSRRPPGRNGYASDGLPDLQMIVGRQLGDGSLQVCDNMLPMIGGVPATRPLAFSNDAATTAAINDLGCRVNDGVGLPLARLTSTDACTSSHDGGATGFAFVNRNSTTQFCLPIARPWAFPVGDTTVAVRLRDQGGNLGEVSEMVVRVERGPVGGCPESEQRHITVARPGSVFRSSGTTLDDVSAAGPWRSDPLTLCIGDEAIGGPRPLRLANDVTFGVLLVDGSVLCARLRAAGSVGVLDCYGGGAHDVTLTQNSHGAGAPDPRRVESGLGNDAGPGAASFEAMVSVGLMPIGRTPDDCRVTGYSNFSPVVLTTATAIVAVEEPVQGGAVTITAQGEPLDCARLFETDSAGAFVLPFTGLDTVVGDTANVLILAD